MCSFSVRVTESRRLWFGASTVSLSFLWGDVRALPAVISGGPGAPERLWVFLISLLRWDQGQAIPAGESQSPAHLRPLQSPVRCPLMSDKVRPTQDNTLFFFFF